MKTIFFAVFLLCICSSIETKAMTNDEMDKMTATILNLNGLLCAKVVDIKPLKVGNNIYEVTCVEYRGGSGNVRYIMDAGTGKAWKP
jgi:hypothetical protein